ncbi:MAG: ATP-dependent DNA helicase RecG [Chloracidobacterium sp.]|nr:ATP-dependent DNA helicase RecG [Chloracidobacterium sp.]
MTKTALSISTPLVEIPGSLIANLSPAMTRKLAIAVAGFAGKTDPVKVTVEDLLNYFPARYEDRSNFVQISELSGDVEAAVEIFVKTSGFLRVGKNRGPRQPPLYIFEITGADEQRLQKPVIVKWFVSGKQAERIVNYYHDRFTRGTRFVAHGKWDWDDRRNTFSLMVNKPEELEILQSEPPAVAGGLTEPILIIEGGGVSDTDELLEDDGDPALATIHTGKVPIYRKLGPFQTKRLREVIHSVLQHLDRVSVAENLPAELLERQDLITRAQALAEIHFPPVDSSPADYEMFRSAAHTRLIFDEFFWLSFTMQLLRGERQKEPKGTVIEISDVTKQRLKEILPFSLTNAQKKVIGEIFSDLKSDAPMNRLIQGDVGSGKTIVAFLAIFAAMENGYQAALMAPTEILAEQHFRNAKTIFEGSGYRAELLTGSTKAAPKRKVYEALAAGEINLVIGTHAIIQDNVKFDRLGLVVIDEQHRFGVLQRAQLRALGFNPDVLVMTATPIPRSLAMTVYGDLDVSIIDELPPGRTPIKTVVLGEDQRHGVYKGIDREVRLGRQVYVVYPLIEESEKMDLKAATIMYEDLRTSIFPQYTVGLLHGKMKPAEKEEIMNDFVAGKLDILVSTTVIEVGVDVPNASLMVIEHAERFGLSQLHQLRGRVGRGAEQSFCVLLTDFKKTAVAKERLGIMEATSDGFKIAEKDLEIRGQGEILGTRQSGIQNFRLGNIVRDLDILVAARKEAEHYLTERRLSPETSKMAKIARSDRKMRLGGIG